MSTSMNYQLQMMESISNIIQQLDERESGKSNKKSIREGLLSDLSDLKGIASKAQKVWEKENKSTKKENTEPVDENRSSHLWPKDDPPRDYGGYELEDPKAKYAARNLSPTMRSREKKKRQIQSQIEKLLKRAPSSWYEKTQWRLIPIDGEKKFFYDRKKDKFYSYPNGRPLSHDEVHSMTFKTDAELEQLKKRKEAGEVVVEESKAGAEIIGIIMTLLAILMKVIFLSI